MINAATIVVRLCLLIITEATPIKSKQHDYSYMKSTRMTTMNMTNWMDRKPTRPQPHIKNLKKSGKGRGCPPQERAHSLPVQYLMVIPKNIHTGNITWSEQVILSIYACNNN